MSFSATARAAVMALTLSWIAFQPAHAAGVTRPFDSTSWQALLSTHKGRPVIVHFWGFSCGNCMVEMKDWGHFAKAHPETTIAFVNWDRRGADPARIKTALDKAGLGGVQSYVLANGFEEKLRFAVDHDWMGELPYTRLIASDGTATTFSGAADFSKLSRWLDGEAWR
jgi:thiol-disulfide isomerase/thioredoxin